jgi:DNA polymerase III alpha subunit (gram-positive type)
MSEQSGDGAERLSRVMIDIETLGLDRHAAIISLGATRFDAGQLGETFYRKINLPSNNSHDRSIDEDTWDWWLDEQNVDESWLRSGDDLDEVLSDFAAWYGSAEEVWANSPSFDCEVLEHAYGQVNIIEPWEFYEERDYRTLSSLSIAPDPEMTGEEHNALDDAEHQAYVTSVTLNQIRTMTVDYTNTDHSGDDA